MSMHVYQAGQKIQAFGVYDLICGGKPAVAYNIDYAAIVHYHAAFEYSIWKNYLGVLYNQDHEKIIVS